MTIIALLLSALAIAVAPPASQSPKDVGDWVAANLWPMGYFPNDRVSGGVSYLLLLPNQDLRMPIVRAWVRYEYFAPREMNGRTALSERMVLDIDCAQGRVRAQTAERFPGQNLQGTPEIIRLDGGWVRPEAGTLSDRQKTFLCAAKDQIVAGPPRPSAAPSQPSAPGGALNPPPPVSTSDADVDAWIAAYLNAEGAFRFEYLPNAVVLLYVPDELQAGRPAKLEVRNEYFRPIQGGGRSIRSDRFSLDVDCDRTMVRMTRGATYADLNGKGEARVTDNPRGGGWEVAPATSGIGRAAALICREMREPGYALSVQKGPRKAPVEAEGRVVPRRR